MLPKESRDTAASSATSELRLEKPLSTVHEAPINEPRNGKLDCSHASWFDGFVVPSEDGRN